MSIQTESSEPARSPEPAVQTIATLAHSPRAVLFDLDGTLADTAPDFASAINQLCIQHGRQPLAFPEVRRVASNGESGLIGAAFGLTSTDPGYSLLRAAFLDHYQAAIADATRLFSGVEEMLAGLVKLGLQWGIVTNKPARYTELLLPAIGLHDAGCVISGDTLAYAKPHPAPLLEAARRLRRQPRECWYVGDDLRDIAAGRAAGMATIAASWGYCERTALPSWQAAAIIDQPYQLIELVQQANTSND